MAEGKEAKPSKLRVFTRRLGSAAFLYGVLLLGLFSQNETLSRATFGGIITLLGVLALLEFFNMAEKRNLAPIRLPGIIVGVGSILAVFWPFFACNSRKQSNRYVYILDRNYRICRFGFSSRWYFLLLNLCWRDHRLQLVCHQCLLDKRKAWAIC